MSNDSSGSLDTTSPARWLAMVSVWAVVSLLVLTHAQFSTDAAAYAQRLSGSVTFDAVRFVADSGIFYWLFGSEYLLSEHRFSATYWIIWSVMFLGLTRLGFRLQEWVLFFALFPGFDLVLNVVRQGFALGAFGLFIAYPAAAYAIAVLAHPLSLLTACYHASEWLGARMSGRGVKLALVAIAVLGATAWFALPELRLVLSTKVLGKLGINPFGPAFLIRIWLTLLVLGALSTWLLEGRLRVKAVVFLIVVALGLAVTPYLYRLLYAFYPVIVLDISRVLRNRPLDSRTIVLGGALLLCAVNLTALLT